eukprot:m.684671 g.684671  ORF g.684671 m.684671 type:complete len:67 (+) comp58610_c1_seq2:597-797(+)
MGDGKRLRSQPSQLQLLQLPGLSAPGALGVTLLIKKALQATLTAKTPFQVSVSVNLASTRLHISCF